MVFMYVILILLLIHVDSLREELTVEILSPDLPWDGVPLLRDDHTSRPGCKKLHVCNFIASYLSLYT